MVFRCIYFASLIIKGLWTLPGHMCFPNDECCRYSQVFWKSLPPVDIPDPWMSWYNLLFWFVTLRQIVPYSVLLNSCSEKQGFTSVEEHGIWMNLSWPTVSQITIMTLNWVQFQGHRCTHHPAVLSTWIHVNAITYMHQHPCVYEHGTTMYLLAKDDIVKRFDGKGMAVVGFEVDQVRRTDHGNLDHGWLLGTLVWLDGKQWILWVDDDMICTLVIPCIHYECYAVIHVMCFFAYESSTRCADDSLYMYCFLSLSIWFPNICETSVHFMLIDTCIPDPCFWETWIGSKKNIVSLPRNGLWSGPSETRKWNMTLL